jgi:hypothetical protein
MNQRAANRPRYWWLWPSFQTKKDARDAAKMGVLACSWVAIGTGLTLGYRYYTDHDALQIIGGLIDFFIICVLGYGILRMSRVASSVALGFFLVELIHKFLQEKSLGTGALLAWCLFQSNRAIYWFKGKPIDAKIDFPRILSCSHCGAEYNTNDYNQDAPA